MMHINYRFVKKLGEMLEIQHNDEDSILFSFKEDIKPIDKIKFGVYLTGKETKIRYNKFLKQISVFKDNGTVDYISDKKTMKVDCFQKLLNQLRDCIFLIFFMLNILKQLKNNIVLSIM